MSKKRFTVLASTWTLMALVITLMPVIGIADEELPLRMRANAGIQTGGRTSIMDISVSEWTTSEERQMLIEYMKEKGTRTLREKLQELSVKGRVNPSGQLGVNWRYAYQFPKSGGRTIILATDRPVNVGEAIGQGVVGRSHNITMAVLELDEGGNGAGTLVLGAELSFGADGKLEVTQVGQNAVHLGNVRVLK